jgi:parallel beta-helix repeat protein
VRNNLIGVNVLSTASGAVLTNNEFYSQSGSDGSTNTIQIDGDSALIEGNIIRNNSQAGISLTSTSQNSIVRGNEIFANNTYSILVNGADNALIEQNIVRNNTANNFITGNIVANDATTVVQDNWVFGNSRPGIHVTFSTAIVQRNTVHDNLDGITGTGTIRDNRIFHNTQAGVRIIGLNPVVSGNAIYANATGIVTAPGAGQSASIINNVIYDSTSFGIDIGTGLTGLSILNNTILEPTGTAIRLNATGIADVRNNILATASGTLLNVANHAQAGFTSDYNLLQITGAGRVGTWGADTLTDLAQWYYEVGRDGHSLAADPQFIDIDGPDGRRGYDVATSTDYGEDDDFRIAFGSPAVNAGDPLAYYAAEPGAGNRINVGAFGNTSDATASPSQGIQLTEPGNFRKYEAGQPITINWISSGFGVTEPLALLNAGGTAIYDPVLGRWSADKFRTSGTNRTVIGTIDMSGIVNPPPVGVLQSYADTFANGANGASMRYDIPLADGTYNVRLFFVEPSGGNVRQFDVRLQGQTVLDNYRIQTDAGAVRKAVAKSFAISAAGGQGLSVQLVNDGSAAGFDAVISGIEITRANPAAPATFSTNLEFSADNGQTWSMIGTNLPVNRFGEGSFTWNATTETIGNTGRFRITAISDGVPSVQHVSEPFSIANNGSAYYINIAGDSNLSDNEYTMASGDNLNTGKSPSSPMRSLAALVRAYDLDAGDTIYVDSGVHGRLRTNVTLTAEDSGVMLQGPTQPGHAAVLTRGTSAIGSAVLELTGGVQNVVVDSFELHTAEYGALITNAANIEIRNSILRSNSNRGIDVGASSSNIRILNNQIRENTSRGIEIRGAQVTVENNLIRNSDRGILVSTGTLSGTTIRDNDIFGHNAGIEFNSNIPGHLIQRNTIHDNATHGIFASGGSSGGLQIIDNEIYGHSGTGDIGIIYSVSQGFALSIRDNQIHHNYFGLDSPSTAGTVQHNQIYANSSAGIRLSGTSNLIDNQVYSNATGILLTGSSTTSSLRNNLIYSNTNVGIDVSNGNYLIVGNTISHPVGTAVRFTGTGTGRFRNNIVQGAVGTLLSVATGGQASFVSDYNLLYPTSAAANVGVWGSTTAPTLASWQSTSGRDLNSISADPLFLDIDGADNVLGELGVSEGNGFDDNFGLRANSPAIDRGDTWNTSAADKEGQPRKDDTGTTNAGRPRHVEASLGSNLFSATGTAQNWRANDSVFTLNFAGGFTFPFYGTTYTSVFVSTNGLLQFGVNTNGTDGTNTTSELLSQRRIAPLWDDLTTALTGDDIFVDTSVVGQIKIRWNASRIGDNSDVQFAVTLVDTGEIQFHYGPGNSNLTPTIGISAGDGVNFDLAQYDGQSNLSLVDSRNYILVPGFVDIGALEFQGTSGDLTPPTVANIQPSQIGLAGTVSDPTNSISISFSEAMDLISARSQRVYQLIGDGLDQQFDTADDVAIAIGTVGYVAGSLDLTLNLARTLPTDRYRLTLYSQSGRALVDQAGNPLDGDENGTAGGDYVRIFQVANAVAGLIDINGSPDAVAENSAEGALVGITANAADADVGDVVTYTLDDSAGGRFAIHPVTGVVTVAGGTLLNREAEASHAITVRASSTDGSTSTRSFTINVNDVDEFNVGPITDSNGGANAVDENAVNGTLVGISATASDGDATTNAINYSLDDNAGGRFAIDSVTGIVTVANGLILNRESASSHSITIRATSADGSSSTQGIVITVNDVDEFNVGAVSDSNPSANRVARNASNGSIVGITASASDADATNNAITYTLDDSAGGRFAINSSTGVVTVAGSLAGAGTSHNIVVRAMSDDGSFSTQAFMIDVVTVGDFDGDNDLDGADVNALSAAIATHSNNLQFDTNGDGVLNFADLQHWILNLKRTVMGDANLDFVVDGSDFGRWNSHKFTADNLWTEGDFNADGFVDGSDFGIWNSNKFTSGPGGNRAEATLVDAVFAEIDEEVDVVGTLSQGLSRP